MTDPLHNAVKPFDQHDACDDCGKRTNGLMTCTYAHDGSTTKLCPDCIRDSGFCLRCGNYCSGMESFDFSDMPGYCRDCRDEINDECSDILDDDEDNWAKGFDEWDDDDFDQQQEDNNPNDSTNL